MATKLLRLPLRVLLVIFVFNFTCCSRHTPTKVLKDLVNWNMIFKKGTSALQRDSVIDRIKNEMGSVTIPGGYKLKDSLHPFATQLIQSFPAGTKILKAINVRARYCSCGDTLFWNLQADVATDSAGPSQPLVVHPPNKTKVSGDYIDELSINERIPHMTEASSPIDADKKLGFPAGFTLQKEGFVSVIDTGIDSSLLDPAVWKGILPYGPSGSCNVIARNNPEDFYDDHLVKHGTSVSSVLMNQFYHSSRSQKLPYLMILKAMDSLGDGDLFSMVCAISYSIRNRASLINISSGYYGEENTTLNYYLELSKMHHIPVVVAAGNSDSVPLADKVCSTLIDSANFLNAPARVFYPACLSPDETRYSVISVTGLRTPGIPCFYQNFSSHYVSVGVVNSVIDKTCCWFKIPFFREGLGVEGSSFATPVVSGRLAYSLMNGHPFSSVGDALKVLGTGSILMPVGIPKATRTFIMN